MPISLLLEYSLPICGIELCVVWILVHYVLEPYAMPKVFGATYTNMDFVARRSLTNHVVSFFLKMLLCCCGVYAIWPGLFGFRPFNAPLKTVEEMHTLTIGDLLAFCYLTVPTIYLFELIYRANISVVSSIHHVGAITINIMGLIIVLGHQQRGFVAATEFKLILIYGTFEMIFESMPHMAVILYRSLRDRPSFLRKVFLATAFGIFMGTFLQQIIIGWFYHHIWHQFPTSYKVVGLILHPCFTIAQLHGGRVTLQIAKKMGEEAKGKKDPEQGELDSTPMGEVHAGGVDLEMALKEEQLPATRRRSGTILRDTQGEAERR